jgi:hypothetical protein
MILIYIISIASIGIPSRLPLGYLFGEVRIEAYIEYKPCSSAN